MQKQIVLRIHEFFGGKYTYLLISLLILIFISPFITASGFTADGITAGGVGRWVVGLMTLLIFLSVIYSLRRKRSVFILFCALAFASFAADLLDITLSTVLTAVIDRGLFAFFCFATTIVIFLDIQRGKKVTQDTISGAISVYLLIAITFAMLYILLEMLQPGTFHYAAAATRGEGMSPIDFYYFSITTLTTVGFGDIVVATSHVKPLVMLESITGIFYIAILVARLVAARGGSDTACK